MGEEQKYTLKADAKQFRLIINALDLYSRILMGQVEEIESFFRWSNAEKKVNFDPNRNQEILEHVMAIKEMVFPELGKGYGSYGIHNPKVCDASKIAYELIQVIRHRLAWDREGNPPTRDWKTMMGVDFDDFSPVSGYPRAEMKNA